MDFLQPTTWNDALAARAGHPDAVPIARGTDLMAGLNLAEPPPPARPDLTRVVERSGAVRQHAASRIRAGVTYRRLIDELATECPPLAAAARTVGPPQIRHRGTVAGNLGTASPAGDAHPPL